MCRLRWSSGSVSPGHDDADDGYSNDDDDDDHDGYDDDDDDQDISDMLMDTAMMMIMTMERMKIPFQGQRQWQLDRQWRLPGKNHDNTFILMMMIMIKMIKIIKKVMGKITIKLDDQVEYFSDVG